MQTAVGEGGWNYSEVPTSGYVQGNNTRFFLLYFQPPHHHHQKNDFLSWHNLRHQKKSKSLFRPNMFTIGGFKGYRAGNMAIKGWSLICFFLYATFCSNMPFFGFRKAYLRMKMPFNWYIVENLYLRGLRWLISQPGYGKTPLRE